MKVEYATEKFHDITNWFLTDKKPTMIKKVYVSIFAVFAMSCSIVKPTAKQQKDHLGNWVLEQRSGGFSGAITDFDIAKKENLLILEENRMIIWENGEKKTEQNYVIENGRVIESAELGYILKGDQSMPQSIVVKNGKLILKAQCYDCYTEVYQRLQ